MGDVVGVELLGVHELVDPGEGDVDLDEVDQETGEEVERDPEHVEVGERDEGSLGVQDVLVRDEDVDREGGQRHQHRGTGPQERGEGVQKSWATGIDFCSMEFRIDL